MTGWMVVYMTEKMKNNEEGIPTKYYNDHFEVFTWVSESGETPKEMATKRYNELITLMDTGKSNLYSVHVCHIKNSSERRYLDVRDKDNQPLKKKI